MTDLTPPPMSEQAIADMAKQIGWDSTEDGLHADVLALVTRAIAARDEQWRQRLEIVGWHYRTNGTWDHFHAGTEPPLDDAYDARSLVPLYRIKEQG